MSLSGFDITAVKQVREMIDRDLRVHHSIGYLAGQAGISGYKLKRCFKLFYKTTLYAYLRERRMLLAAETLQHTGKTLQQVSRLTGFRYYSNFTRAFRKHFGVTPDLYRQQYHQNIYA